MDYTKYNTAKFSSTSSFASSYDVGLRSYMVSVYKYMALALLLSGVVALAVASSPSLVMAIFSTPLYIVVAFAPVALAFYMSFRFVSMSVQSVKIFFWLYAALLGVSLSSLLLVYTAVSITKVFFITSSLFGAMSIYGYSTKRDLSGFGSFLFMGLIGILIASLVNIFIRSSAMDFVLSIVGVLVFTGLTAYDTQRIKDIYYRVAGSGEAEEKLSIYGAFALYIDFVNLFIMMLRFFGDRRSS